MLMYSCMIFSQTILHVILQLQRHLKQKKGMRRNPLFNPNYFPNITNFNLKNQKMRFFSRFSGLIFSGGAKLYLSSSTPWRPLIDYGSNQISYKCCNS